MPEVPPPTVSVVVPTFNRRDNLEAVLAPLLADPALHEAVVVVDGCHDGSLELLQTMATEAPKLRPLWIENSGGAAARQLGIEACTGGVVLLLDDDVVAAPGLVGGHAQHHGRASGLVVLGYMPTRLPAPGSRGTFATVLYAQEYESVCASYQTDPRNILLRLWGGNVSIRRADLDRVPYQSGSFSLTNHSDRDFGLRCLKAGLHGVFDPQLLSSHVHERPLPAFLRDARRQGAGRALVHAAHEDVLGPLQMDDTLLGLPRPVRELVKLDRYEPVRVATSKTLLPVARIASRTGWTRVELATAKVLRRLETRRGIREATSTL